MKKLVSTPVHRDYAVRRSAYEVITVSADTRRTRLTMIFAGAAVWTLLLVGRLYYLQLAEFGRWRQSAMRQHISKVELAAERGPIYDRNGKLLAVSVPSGSVFLRPRKVKDHDQVAQQLAETLNVPADSIREKFKSKSPFVWVKRQIPRVEAERVRDLEIDGVDYLMESHRYYPLNQAASALIGIVGVDGNGLSGLEARYERRLNVKKVSSTVSRDALGNSIELDGRAEDFRLPKGAALQLTLDAGLQLIVDEELQRGLIDANAKAAMAVMIDAESGDVLAMSQAPARNYNASGLRSRAELKNIIAESVFEPGSIMKPIVAAAALESGVVGAHELIDCEKGSYRFGRHIINDVHPKDILTFRQVVIQSSNIGMTKIGMRMGMEKIYSSLRDFGFGQYSGLRLPGESGGILRPTSSWSKVDVATHSFGQGVAVNALQVVRAVAAIANGGVLPALKLVADDNTAGKPVRILSDQTAATVQDMMYGVVEDKNGTGKRAAISGVRVGGKTGTAQRAREGGRGYEPGAYIASFVGFADGSSIGINRKLVMLVSVDRPDTTSIYGGTLAGPVFQRAMSRSLHLLTTRSAGRRGAEERVEDYGATTQSRHFTQVSYRP